MTSRELISRAIRRLPAERIALTDMSFWPETITRWEREGLPVGADVYGHFGLDRVFIWDIDDSPRLAERVLEEDEESVTVSDSYGCVVRSWKNSYAPPVHLSYAAKDISEVDTAVTPNGADGLTIDWSVELKPSQAAKKLCERMFVRDNEMMHNGWKVKEYVTGQ